MVPSCPASVAFSAATVAPGPPQCAEVKPIRRPALSWPIVVSVQNVSPLTVIPEPPPSTTGSACATPGVSNATRASIGVPTTNFQRRLVAKCPPIDAPDPRTPKRIPASYLAPDVGRDRDPGQRMAT